MIDHLLLTAALDPPVKDDIVRLMSAPDRHYHDLGHLGRLWSRHRHCAPGTPFAGDAADRLIACAIAFHDAIYDPTRDDNEARSATFWRDAAPADLTAEQVNWVTDTIAATADHLAVTDCGTAGARLRLWMLDLDLSPLGEPPALFARNTRALRLEFAHLDDAAWSRRRIGFLRRLLAAKRLFRSPPLATAFEGQARRNIERELHAAAC